MDCVNSNIHTSILLPSPTNCTQTFRPITSIVLFGAAVSKYSVLYRNMILIDISKSAARSAKNVQYGKNTAIPDCAALGENMTP